MIDNALTQSMERRDRDQNYKMDDDPFIGAEDAPVVIVEFSDFLCGFCGRHFDQTLTPILENYDGYVRYVYRDFPGVGGQNAVQSALAAECADDQDKFWDYHTILFNNQDQLGTDLTELRTVLIDFATELELDIDAFTECYDSDRYVTEILLDRSDGEAAGMRGTPGFLINGRFLSGAQPYEAFAAVIDDELAKRGISLEEAS
jgi:protein-disulfide isomerase